MKSSPTLRVLMAAGMYLLLMWGYVTLQTPQLYAAFVALIMSIALLFWVSEARAPSQLEMSLDQQLASASDERLAIDHDEPSLSASILRLDSLKAELTQQYAQFGRDQSLLNRKGLGAWHQNRGERGGEQ